MSSTSEWQSYPSSSRISEWALEAARSTTLARRVSAVMFALSALTLTVGLLGAGSVYWAVTGGDNSMGGSTWLGIAQSSSVLLTSLLPTGLFVAAGAYLRLQTARFDTEILAGADDDEPGDVAPGEVLPG